MLAYVRNARKGEVTVVSGLHETTFRDAELVKRMTRGPPTRAKRRASKDGG